MVPEPSFALAPLVITYESPSQYGVFSLSDSYWEAINPYRPQPNSYWSESVTRFATTVNVVSPPSASLTDGTLRAYMLGIET